MNIISNLDYNDIPVRLEEDIGVLNRDDDANSCRLSLDVGHFLFCWVIHSSVPIPQFNLLVCTSLDSIVGVACENLPCFLRCLCLSSLYGCVLMDMPSTFR